MMKGKIFTVPYRRKREGKTYYKKRLKLLTSDKPRLVVRRSLRNIQASIVKYDAKGDRILFTITTKGLEKLGWKGDPGNLPSAYLTGLLAGKKAHEKGIKEAIFDMGYNKSIKGSRLYAALQGAADSGLKIPFDKEIVPPKERISGEHISKYAKELKNDTARYKKQFATYLKKGLNPEEIVNHFNEIKGKINNG